MQAQRTAKKAKKQPKAETRWTITTPFEQAAQQQQQGQQDRAEQKALLKVVEAPEAVAEIPPELVTEPAAEPANVLPIPALRPTKPDCGRCWFMTCEEGFWIKPVRLSDDELNQAKAAWDVTKFSDGTTYRLRESWSDEHKTWLLFCSCPGATAHGPLCNGGKGCKHARMITASALAKDTLGVKLD